MPERLARSAAKSLSRATRRPRVQTDDGPRVQRRSEDAARDSSLAHARAAASKARRRPK